MAEHREVVADQKYSDLIGRGSYARKQIFSRDIFVAWSHGSRFKLACKLVEQYAGGKLLDYGSGDGTFLAMASNMFESALGVDPDLKQVQECATRFSEIPNLSFLSVQQISGVDYNGRYDAIVCMEVLEHCLPDILDQVLSDLRRLVKPTGAVIISVPVEIGPTLLAKQLLRRAAALRNVGDYKYFEKYSWRDFMKMLFANRNTAITRPVFFADPGQRTGPFHGHKGFNWRSLKLRLERFFTLKQLRFSPAGWSCGYASSQVWFICIPRECVAIE